MINSSAAGMPLKAHAPTTPTMSTEPLTPDTSMSDLNCSRFTFDAYVVFFGSMCVFGLAGNWVSWAVLSWERRNSGRVATFLLQTMAVVDNLFLTTAGISHITTAVMLYIESKEVDAKYSSSSSSHLSNSSVQIAQTDSVLSTEDDLNQVKTTRVVKIGLLLNADKNNLATLTTFVITPLKAAVEIRAQLTDELNLFELTKFIDMRQVMLVMRLLRVKMKAREADKRVKLMNSQLVHVSRVLSHISLCCTTVLCPCIQSTAYLSPVGAYVKAYVTLCVWPLVHVTQMWAVWITVLVAFNRYIAICRPFQAHRLCTMKQVRLQTAALGLAILIYNFPRFFENQIVYTIDMAYSGDQLIPEGAATDLKNSLVYNIIYENLLYCLFVFLGPLIILIVLNACLVRELVLASQRLKERRLPADAAADQGEQNLTLVMVVIILIFVVCQSPAFANQILFYLIGEQYVCGRAYFYFYHVSNLLVSANSSVNFVVYCVFRRQFRRRLYNCCCSLFRHPRRSGSQTFTYTTDHYPLTVAGSDRSAL